MCQRQLLVMAAALAALCLAIPVLGQQPNGTASDLERFTGTWEYAGTREQGTQIIHDAVDRTVESMNFMTRGFAADRLREKNPLVERIDISTEGDELQVVFDGERHYRAPLNQWRAHTFQDETVRVQFRQQDDSLVQLFGTESGVRRNVYRLLGDDRMQLEVTIQSEQIPRDMRYELDYRRR